MVKPLFISLLVLGLGFPLWGQDTENTSTPDSSRILRELVVEDELNTVNVNKASFKPTRQQRQSATDGLSLLRAMSIPRIAVDMASGTVTTGGAPVTFFIDGVPASGNDLADMNTRDVQRVEILDFPSDPMFRNASHVVNFVMNKYVYGGYSKIRTTQMILSDFSSANSANSKMVYKRMTYDARADFNYSNFRHNGMFSNETFDLPALTPEAPEIIYRQETTDFAKVITKNASGSFRAQYRDQRTVFNSTIGFIHSGRPTSRSGGRVLWQPWDNNDLAWQNAFNTRTNAISWLNDLFSNLANDWSLSMNLNLEYSHNNKNQNLTEGPLLLRQYAATENSVATNGKVNISKKISPKHRLGAAVTFDVLASQLEYDRQENFEFNSTRWNLKPTVSYDYSAGDKFSAGAKVSLRIAGRNIADSRRTEFTPDILLSSNYMPNSHNWFSFGLFFSRNSPSPVQTNPVVMQHNPLMWSQGNPELKDYYTGTFRLYYAWNPSQKFALASVLTLLGTHDYIGRIYTPARNGTALLQQYANCGNSYDASLRVSPTVYALRRHLVLQANLEAKYQRLAGTYSMDRWSVFASAYGAYYFGSFSLSAQYQVQGRCLSDNPPLQQERRPQLWLRLGWGSAQWNLDVSVINPWRSHWRGTRTTLDTPYYSFHGEGIGIADHRRINFSVTYTIGYGRKVRPGNDLEERGGPVSGIE